MRNEIRKTAVWGKEEESRNRVDQQKVSLNEGVSQFSVMIHLI
jgi:hypothetical protein